MEVRFDYLEGAPGLFRAMMGLEEYLRNCSIDHRLIHLIKLRASQINGCAYCLDMHWKDLKAIGEDEQRMYELNAWRESPFYTERERAALEWTEAVTCVSTTHVPEDVYQHVKKHFSQQEIADLTGAIATINAWNRLAIASRAVPGKYQPIQAAQQQRPSVRRGHGYSQKTQPSSPEDANEREQTVR
jgi:AhpD family alkylhydroperoxidase